MHLRSRLLMLMFAAFAYVTAARAVAPETPLSVTLASHEYPPFMSERLPYGGLLTRIVTESFKAASVQVNVLSVSSNNRVIIGLMTGMYDGGYGWAHAPERDRRLLYSKSSIYTFRMVFFQRRSNEISWNSLADLAPFQIGTTLGNHYSDEFSDLHARKILHVQEAASDPINMRKLLIGRIDLFPMEEEAGRMLILHSLTLAEQASLSFQARPFALIPTYLVLRRDLPHAAELLDRFDQGYRQLNDSGQLARIISETRNAVMSTAQTAQGKRNRP